MDIAKTLLNISLKIILVGSFIFSTLLLLSVGWEFYGISTDRGGLTYNYYIYYNLSKTEILIHIFFILIALSTLVFFQIFTLKKGNNKQILLALIAFAFILLLLNTYETYLASRFIPKG